MKSAPHELDSALGRRSTNRRPAALGFLLALAACIPFPAISAPSAVVTDTGSFIGVPSPSQAGVNVFFGIRYAAPPEGALRWTPHKLPRRPPLQWWRRSRDPRAHSRPALHRCLSPRIVCS